LNVGCHSVREPAFPGKEKWSKVFGCISQKRDEHGNQRENVARMLHAFYEGSDGAGLASNKGKCG
jgi:hypothetical protein